MTVKNYPGPYEVELQYSVAVGTQTLLHKQRLNCNVTNSPAVGTTFNLINVARRALADVALDNMIIDYINLIDGQFNSANVSIVGANLYKYVPNSFVKTFVSSYTSGAPGTSASAVQPATQQTLTFRTQEGGRFRLTYLETSSGFRGIDTLPLADATMSAIVTFVIGTGNWILGRDTSYPVSFIRQLGGENESVFDKRFRL
jgi:hypothetical protein